MPIGFGASSAIEVIGRGRGGEKRKSASRVGSSRGRIAARFWTRLTSASRASRSWPLSVRPTQVAMHFASTPPSSLLTTSTTSRQPKWLHQRTAQRHLGVPRTRQMVVSLARVPHLALLGPPPPHHPLQLPSIAPRSAWSIAGLLEGLVVLNRA